MVSVNSDHHDLLQLYIKKDRGFQGYHLHLPRRRARVGSDRNQQCVRGGQLLGFNEPSSTWTLNSRPGWIREHTKQCSRQNSGQTVSRGKKHRAKKQWAIHCSNQPASQNQTDWYLQNHPSKLVYQRCRYPNHPSLLLNRTDRYLKVSQSKPPFLTPKVIPQATLPYSQTGLTGISRAHSSPPSLQLICMATLVTTLISCCFFWRVLARMHWEGTEGRNKSELPPWQISRHWLDVCQWLFTWHFFATQFLDGVVTVLSVSRQNNHHLREVKVQNRKGPSVPAKTPINFPWYLALIEIAFSAPRLTHSTSLKKIIPPLVKTGSILWNAVAPPP